MTKVLDLVHQITNKLAKVHHDNPQEQQQDAWWMLEKITGTTTAELIAHDTLDLTKEQQKQLDEWLHLHIDKHMPLQYILGTVPFNGLEILTEPPVLIPRPETEEWTIKLCNNLAQLSHKKITVLDIGAGTGCIALSLAKTLPESQVYATDITRAALELTQKNAQHNTITNVTVIRSDLFTDIPQTLKFDLIVSNPPYIDLRQWPLLNKSVTKWEDKHALLAGRDGLEVIKKIIAHAKPWLSKNPEFKTLGIPQLVIEIGYQQGNAVHELLEQAGFNNIRIENDLEGKDRVACAEL